MDINIAKWESVLQADPGLQDRLKRLNPKGYPATIKGDLLCLAITGQSPLVVSWDGAAIAVTQRQPKKPFLLWNITREKFSELFSAKCPPVLVAMNNDQKNITAGADHHNGSLVVSFLVMLQECMEGGESA
jgi:hypothetical protein